MDIIGKYLVAKMFEPDFWRTVGISKDTSKDSGELFALSGEVAGEKDHGLWVKIDSAYRPDMSSLGDVHNAGQNVMTTFVPWSRIVSASLFNRKPPTVAMGFRIH